MLAAISNSSPLIILAKAEFLEFLPRQFSKILVPEAVRQEIMDGPVDDPMRNLISTLPWIEIVRLDPPLSPLGYLNLGRGESEVIEYSRIHKGLVALLDDRAARKVAEGIGIKVYGTLSILARQVNMDTSLSFDDSVERVRQSGLYLNDKLIESVKDKMKK